MKIKGLGYLNIAIVGLIIAATSALVGISTNIESAADVCTWTGAGDGVNFSDNANWSGCDNGGQPENSDDLIFPDLGGYTVNFATGFSANNVTMQGGVTLAGNGNLAMDGALTIESTGNVFNNNLTMQTNPVIASTSGGEVTLNGVLILSAPLSINTNAHLITSNGSGFGGVSNDFTINGGELTIGHSSSQNFGLKQYNILNSGRLNCSAVLCTSISDGVVVNNGTVRLTNNNINFVTPISIIGGPDNVLESVGSNTVFSGAIVRVSSPLRIVGDLGNFTASINPFYVNVTGIISGDGPLELEGGVTINANNTYTGRTAVRGLVTPESNNAFGATGIGNDTVIENTGTVVFNSAADVTLSEEFIVNDRLGLNNPAFYNLNPLGAGFVDGAVLFLGERSVGVLGSGKTVFRGVVTVTSPDTELTANNSSEIVFLNDIIGPGGFEINGDAFVVFGSPNSFAGDVDVRSGKLTLDTITNGYENYLGNTVGQTNIHNGGEVEFLSAGSNNHNVEELLVFNNGSELDIDAFGSEDNIFENVVVNGSTVFDVDDSLLTIYDITGSGFIEKDGNGALDLNSDTTPAFSGSMLVTDGSLFSDMPTDQVITNGVVTYDFGSRGDFIEDNKHGTAVRVDVIDALVTWVGDNEFSENVRDSIGELDIQVDGTVGFAEAEIEIGGNNADSEWFGEVLMAGIVELTKVGSGTLLIDAPIASTGVGPTNAPDYDLIINDGVVDVRQGYSEFDFRLTNGVLKGSGQFGNVTTEGGSVRPGTSPGIMSVVSLTLDSNSTVEFELNGTVQGIEYDLIDSAGAVILNNASIELVPGFTPSGGDTFTIIQSTEPILTAFAGYPEGSVISVNMGGVTQMYTISYLSNNVTLTYVGSSVFTETGDALSYSVAFMLLLMSLLGLGWGVKQIKNPK